MQIFVVSVIRARADSPQKLRNHTHLIIDEVHERSIDSDLRISDPPLAASYLDYA